MKREIRSKQLQVKAGNMVTKKILQQSGAAIFCVVSLVMAKIYATCN